MDRVETLNGLEKSFAVSISKSREFNREVLFRLENSTAESNMTRSVNNYLKTPAEIETECSQASSDGNIVLETWLRSKLTQDGYRDIHNLDEILSRDMEENY